MASKLCSKCQLDQELSSFNKDKSHKDGYRSVCRMCQKRATNAWYRGNKEYCNTRHKEWIAQNPDRNVELQKRWRETHKKQCAQRCKEWYDANKTKDSYEKHRSRRRLYKKQRKESDLNFKILCNLRIRLWHAVKNGQKRGKTLELLECSIEELRTHLESLFFPGMSWENYGEWHIDHKIPLASFDLTDSEQLKQAGHYKNLQPLWAKDNFIKGDKSEIDCS